ncbi:hypothetical protein EW145_g800 [Phellinidium pouzarii]|uniref:Vesicular-fusion protein SEC17 n=1 Tax=Phellinidium pouzarii TaxID=167371 RepID=A0A4S4LHJ8_9AGAM|nr:hypothetical protein EW145_g800 [Phellinidium pouzarii]
MAPQKSPAEVLFEKAVKKSAASTGWFSSSSSKYEEAGDLFQQAANAFKLEKEYTQAGDAFSKEAECREKCNESSDAANAWWNAAKAFKQAESSDLALQAFAQTVLFLTKSGRFRQAADRQKDIAQLYLQTSKLQEACDSYEKAGDWYKQEDAIASANTCFKDAADLHAQIGNYQNAIVQYELVADQSRASDLTKFSIKEYWLRSGLCALANSDSVTAKRNMERYANLDSTFSGTREAKLLSALIEAVESGDSEAFATACRDYDQITKLDNWKIAILMKAKKTIGEDEPSLT